MIKITSIHLNKTSQTNWLDEIRDVDWGKEDEGGDWTPGHIDDTNFENYLVDDMEQDAIPHRPHKNKSINNKNLEETPIPDYMEEIPRTNYSLGIPEKAKEIEYKSAKRLVYDGIDKTEVISFDYTNRHGTYAGFRTTEPHYTFIARSTGNEVLVTFDRDAGDIRAFIVGNIHPDGVRYDGVKFQPRPEIMTGI